MVIARALCRNIVYIALLGRPAVTEVVFTLLGGDLVETEGSCSQSQG
jgi:hypothetical protein